MRLAKKDQVLVVKSPGPMDNHFMDIATKIRPDSLGRALLIASLGVTVACAPSRRTHDRSSIAASPATAAPSPCHPDQLTSAPMQPVFDGSGPSLAANWHSWKQDRVSQNWQAENGVLTLAAGAAGDELVLNGAYQDFALSFHWAVPAGGNSGVKYNVKEASGQPVGLEYQILDDEQHPDAQMGRNGNRKSASIYDILPRAQSGVLNPAGAFNRGCIVFRHRQVEHWLNGALVLSAALDDPLFKQAVRDSKFKNHAGFLDTPPAQIFLQAHGEAVTFKDIQILAL